MLMYYVANEAREASKPQTTNTMKTETEALLSAMLYLIDRGLTPAELRSLILESLNHDA